MIEASEFREALKDFPSGVTIVTSADSSGAPVGATVSSFTSLSIDPPLVLVCLKRESRSCAAIAWRGAFAVHFLAASQAALARRFAADLADKFSTAHYSFNDAGVPCLEDCRLRLECRLARQYEGGDHLIFVGQVERSARQEEFEPLVYARRGFFALGNQLPEN